MLGRTRPAPLQSMATSLVPESSLVATSARYGVPQRDERDARDACILVGPEPPQTTHRTRCIICEWRNAVLPYDDNSSPHDTVHTPLADIVAGRSRRGEQNRHIMQMMHQRPTDLWCRILEQSKLYAGHTACVLDTRYRKWSRFPCRNMRLLQRRPSTHLQTTTTFVEVDSGKFMRANSDGTFTGYHMTKVEYLVGGVFGDGIFVNGGMNYGDDHRDGIGVYMYVYPPFELFNHGDGGVLLEINVHGCLKRVKHGSRGRYLVRSNQVASTVGSPCLDVEVVAMWSLHDSLPKFLLI